MFKLEEFRNSLLKDSLKGIIDSSWIMATIETRISVAEWSN